MTRRLSCALIIVTLSAAPTFAQTQAAPKPTPQQIERMLEPLRPSAEHRLLAQLEGRWRQEVTYAMGGPPMKASGTVTNRMILGGRFLVSEGTSNNPSEFGDSAVEFMSIYGFDRRTGEYTIAVHDTMGTYYVTAAGKPATAGFIVMSGETLEYEKGTKAMRKYDMTLRIVDPNTYVTEIIFKSPSQPDRTVVSVTHRRMP